MLCEVKPVQYLFNNISLRQTILKNAFWLSIAQGVAGLANFVLAVIVIRKFGAAEYGRFIYGFSLASLFSTLYDFGLATAVTREFAGDPKREEKFAALWTLRIFLGLLVFAVICIVAFVITSDVSIRHMIVVLALYVFTLELLNFCFALIRARQKMEMEAVLRLLCSGALIAAILTVIQLKCTVAGLAWAYLSANIITLIMTIVLMVTPAIGSVSIRFVVDLASWKEFIVIGWYLALTKGVGDIALYTDSVLLGYLNQTVENGWYNAAVRVARIVMFPMGLVAGAVFPTFLAAMRNSGERFHRLWLMWNKLSVFMAGLFGFGLYTNAETIVGALYPAGFAPAAAALKILALMTSVVYIQTPFYHILLALGQQKKLFFIIVVAAISNVTLNLLLIPRFSLYGASIASLVFNLVILMQYLWFLKDNSVIKPLCTECVSVIIAVVATGLTMQCVVKTLNVLRGHVVAEIVSSLLLFALCFWLVQRLGRALGIFTFK